MLRGGRHPVGEGRIVLRHRPPATARHIAAHVAPTRTDSAVASIAHRLVRAEGAGHEVPVDLEGDAGSAGLLDRPPPAVGAGVRERP
jgi:hypothetical protein